MKIINLGMLLLVMSLSSPVQASSHRADGIPGGMEVALTSSFTSVILMRAEVLADTHDIREEEDLPFDNASWGGYIMNWIAKLLLWFIYLTVMMMILGGTVWFLTSSGFWSWVLCMTGAFFYAMLLGRYWGYTACLIGFVILFTLLKLLLTSGWGKKKMGRFSNSGLNKRMRKLSAKSAKKKGDTIQ